MTDKERKAAERLAKKAYFLDELYGHREAFIQGYAAACEAKRAEVEPWDKLMRETHWELEAERARSAKLIEAIRAAWHENAWEKIDSQMELAIKEYETQSRT